MSSKKEFETNISFDLPKNQSNVIKVIGVGGGGSNAINHMFQQGIKGVDFYICNTDAQALQNSGVPNKIQLGLNLTEGLGAGANPDIGEQSAVESFDDIDDAIANIVIAQTETFSKRQKPNSVAISLRIKHGSDFLQSKGKIEAVERMIMSSIVNLKQENVTIVDRATGKVLND